MAQQLNSPQRDDALGVIRETARPADELASAVRERDYSRLRDMTRNRHASELADMLTDSSVEDQVVAFRVLPRKDAAASSNTCRSRRRKRCSRRWRRKTSPRC